MKPFLKFLAEDADDLTRFLVGFFHRHPALHRYNTIRIKQRPASGTVVAQVQLGVILIHPKFWELPDVESQDFTLAHEIGHWVLGEYGLSAFTDVADRLHADVWNNLPFGQFSMEEAFADCFASYHTDHDVQRRYPQWAAVVKAVTK